MLTDKESFKTKYRDKFISLFGKNLSDGGMAEKYRALAGLVRDEIGRKWAESREFYDQSNAKKVYYLSIEFLPGRFLLNNLYYLGIKEPVEKGLSELGIELSHLADMEEDPGLGNGGLGRLSSAFLDSLASLSYQAQGCGIRYRYGFFEQKLVDGEQVECPDNWLENGCPWEYRCFEEKEYVKFGGGVTVKTEQGRMVFTQNNYELVMAVPYDIPILGYQNGIVNTMRLWSAESWTPGFDFHTFCRGEFALAFQQRQYAESLSQVLYPDDSTYEGRKLRLKQEYFFVSASIQSIIKEYKKKNNDIRKLPEKIAIHINDTHPSLAVAELMRILLDEEGLEWVLAWELTTAVISYTNHTILPEALEKWPLDLFQSLLPRIYMIVEEINRRLCDEVLKAYPGEHGRVREMAVIADGYVRMGNLAIVGSHSINGVARLHTEILKKRVMNSFNEFFPERFNNKTNGITHRRWLLQANPELSRLITDAIGPDWIKHPEKLAELVQLAGDVAFREEFATVKKKKKAELASFIRKKYGVELNPDSIFDIHIKRIHGYKRQLLNVFHIIDLYNRLREDPVTEITPRSFIFGGKAAPSYYLAKRVIKLINTVSNKINNDKSIGGRIKVVFLENYNVSLAELAFPAADVSEQISTASKEASGTGNMKFMMNGAVTIGTMDGANIEIMERVGADNFIAFGISADEVMNYYLKGGYNSWDVYRQDERVKTVCEQLINGFWGKEEFRSLYDHLLKHNDEFFVLGDFASYAAAQKRLAEKFRDYREWIRMSIHNTAHSGIFSSDRAIEEYADEIWKLKKVLPRHS